MMKVKRVEFGKSVRVDGMQELYLDLMNKHKGIKVDAPSDSYYVTITSLKGNTILVPITNISELQVVPEVSEFVSEKPAKKVKEESQK